MNITPERIEELRAWALALITGPVTCHLAQRDCPWPEATPEIRADLLSLLDEMAELRAEVERLKKLICSGDNEQARLFLHQAGVMAELATDRCRLIAEGNCLKARAEKAEAYAEKLSRERNAAISALEKAEAEVEGIQNKILESDRLSAENHRTVRCENVEDECALADLWTLIEYALKQGGGYFNEMTGAAWKAHHHLRRRLAAGSPTGCGNEYHLLMKPAPPATAETCPICQGTRVHGHVLGGTNPATCYACAGRGYIFPDQPAPPKATVTRKQVEAQAEYFISFCGDVRALRMTDVYTLLREIGVGVEESK